MMSRILIIDDDDLIRQMLRAVLEREGYDVLDASDGREGLRVFMKNPVDLVVTDLVMPEKEGLEIIIELRRNFPDLKIIAISGGGTVGGSQYLDVAGKLGADKIMGKPLKLREFIAIVKGLMKD
jgi:DNA-binding response OmpR family regulator